MKHPIMKNPHSGVIAAFLLLALVVITIIAAFHGAPEAR